MTQLPNSAIPPGVDPIAYLNWQAQMQAYLAREQSRGNEDQSELVLRLLDDAQRRQEQARQDNETRRLEILQGRVDTRNRVLGDINQYGDSLISDTNRDFKDSLNNSLSALAGSGLLHSTEQASIRARNERERTDAQRRNKDSLLQHRTSADERLSNAIDEFQERVTDSYPTLQPINSLLERAGQSELQLGGYGNSPFVRRTSLSSNGAGVRGGAATTAARTPANSRPTVAPVAGGGGSAPSPGVTPGRPIFGSSGSSNTPSGLGGGSAYRSPPLLRAPTVSPQQLEAQRIEAMRQRNIQSQMAQQQYANQNQGRRQDNFTIFNERLPGYTPSMVPQQIVQDVPAGVSRITQGQPQFGNTGGYGGGLDIGGLLSSLYHPTGGGYGVPSHAVPNNYRQQMFDDLERQRNLRRQMQQRNRFLSTPTYPALNGYAIA